MLRTNCRRIQELSNARLPKHRLRGPVRICAAYPIRADRGISSTSWPVKSPAFLLVLSSSPSRLAVSPDVGESQPWARRHRPRPAPRAAECESEILYGISQQESSRSRFKEIRHPRRAMIRGRRDPVPDHRGESGLSRSQAAIARAVSRRDRS